MIRLDEVSKTYAQGEALSGISLQIDPGELVLLTGPSGAGKTTLLQLLIGAVRADAGAIEIDGADITRLRNSAIPYLRRNFGVVFQDYKLLKRLTALQNVRLALEIRGTPRSQANHQALETLSALGLEPLAQTPIQLLSGGEQQRVAIARALVGQPAIVLADEPTGSLDPDWSQDILGLLNRAARAGTTVVVATHDPALVAGADYTQCAQLADGRVVEITRRTRRPEESTDDDTPSASAAEQPGEPTEPTSR